MSNDPETVVKCGTCDNHFGHSEIKTKCPFCKAEYVEVKEKPKDLPAQAGRKVPVKTQKESFKMWENN